MFSILTMGIVHVICKEDNTGFITIGLTVPLSFLILYEHYLEEIKQMYIKGMFQLQYVSRVLTKKRCFFGSANYRVIHSDKKILTLKSLTLNYNF